MTARSTVFFSAVLATAFAASSAMAADCEGVGARKYDKPVILKKEEGGATTMLIRSTGSNTVISGPGVTGDASWQQCSGFWTINADKSGSGSGSCFLMDGDGDQWIQSWEGDDAGGTWAHVSGTGKYAGMENSKGTWTRGARYGDELSVTSWKGTCGS